MASQSSKKLASANVEVLNKTHLQALIINAIVLLIILIFKRPSSLKPYVIFSLPSFVLQYILEKNGRPQYAIDQSSKKPKLVKCGDDISREGLYEYMFDVLYITWILDVLMIILGTNRIWWLYLIIPGYAGSKLVNIILPFIKKNKTAAETVESTKPETTKSKRQTKLEARREKGQAVKYR